MATGPTGSSATAVDRGPAGWTEPERRAADHPSDRGREQAVRQVPPGDKLHGDTTSFMTTERGRSPVDSDSVHESDDHGE